MSTKVVTRFAPSPTGFMHVGSVRTALYAYLFAKKNHGTFILRIEDTDKAREVEGSIEHIIKTLKWLGLDWDEGIEKGGPNGPYKQSERLDSYIKYANLLIKKGHAYPDPYSDEELENFRNEYKKNNKVFLFRDLRPDKLSDWDGKTTLRFKVPEIKSYTWHDEVRGELSAGEEALDDFVLIKKDGYPTYNFAHIIDDLEMNVTHIMRADEFIASTPKFLSLYEALEITPPKLVTLPPILGEDGTKKLGKRDGAKDILDYKNEGYIPETLVNFLALTGWNPGTEEEIMSVDKLIELFGIEKIHSSGAMFNEQKLLWMNKEHIKIQSTDEKIKYLQEFLPNYPTPLLKKIHPLITERISRYGELKDMEENEFRLFIEKPNLSDVTITWKNDTKHQSIKHLTEINKIIYNIEIKVETNDLTALDFDVDTVKNFIMPYAEINGKGNVLWPLRVALSGKEKSIDPFTLIAYLGKIESIERINFAINKLNEN